MTDADQSHTVRLLLAVRTRHDWSQRQLAEALLVSRRTVIRWESGEHEPPPYLLAALRELLDA